MKKNRNRAKKLRLAKSTVRQLSSITMVRVAGGVETEGLTCEPCNSGTKSTEVSCAGC